MRFLELDLTNIFIKQSATEVTATPSANVIPIADANGKLDNWVSASSSNIDGGNSLSNYTLDQNLDCGSSA